MAIWSKDSWEQGPGMPVAMTRYVQSVEISGTVYVGGGYTDANSEEDRYKVMAYSFPASQWNTLSSYSKRGFAMTAIRGKLVLVGGLDEDNDDSRDLGEWQPDGNIWTNPFPSLPSARGYPSATSFQEKWLIVAGGHYQGYILNTVDILDVSQMQWSTEVLHTPRKWKEMKSVTIGDTWYLMGGVCDYEKESPHVFSVSLEALVKQKASDSSKIWNELPVLDCQFSCPLVSERFLYAVGGQSIQRKIQVSTIKRYDPDKNTWVRAGRVKRNVSWCTCIMISNKLHIFGGYNGRTRCNDLFISTNQ